MNSKKLRVGLIGCGAFGESHLATLTGIPFVEVTTVADVVATRAETLASRYKVPQIAPGFRELCVSEAVDAVNVVTTEDQHLEPVLTALERGKHVFVEKPMAINTSDAQKMVAAAHKTGRILMPGHILRFETRYATVKEQLVSGRLGRVMAIYARRNRPKWQGKIYKRTPLVFETAIHDIDTMLWYVGKKVKSVRTYEVSAAPGKNADFACGVVQFEDGALGVLQTTWMIPDKTAFLDDCMQVVATSGIANIDVLHSGLTLWRDEGMEVPDVCYEPRLRGSVFGALREELSYFAHCALEGRQPTVVTAEDGLEAVRIGSALVESSRLNREIPL